MTFLKVVMVFLVWPSVAEAANCKHLSGYSSHGQSCFKLYTIDKSWSAAESACAGEGGHLASIHNNGEKKFIEKLVNATSEDVWIGLKGSPSSMAWSDKTGLDYQNWYVGAYYSWDVEPNGSGDCVRMKESYNYQWAYIGCSTAYYFLCRAVAAPDTQTTTTPATTTTTPATTTTSALSAVSTVPRFGQNQVCFTQIQGVISMDPAITPSSVYTIRSTIECARRCHVDTQCLYFIMREEGKYLCETYTSIARPQTAATMMGNYEKKINC